MVYFSCSNDSNIVYLYSDFKMNIKKQFSDKCFFCGDKIKVILRTNSIEGIFAYFLKRNKWIEHKLICEAKYWEDKDGNR